MPRFSLPENLPRAFFLPPPDLVARALLGARLVRRLDGEVLSGRIVETEAYFGADDPAAHAFTGRTARNAALWGPPGHAYVYFIYGLHSCLNVSCEPEGAAGCVLVRALEPLAGLATMARLRGLPEGATSKLLASGRSGSRGPDSTGRTCSIPPERCGWQGRSRGMFSVRSRRRRAWGLRRRQTVRCGFCWQETHVCPDRASGRDRRGVQAESGPYTTSLKAFPPFGGDHPELSEGPA